MTRPKAMLLPVIFLFFAMPVLAHTLYLKDGRVIRGKIIAQTRTEIRIDVNGTVSAFQKSDIREVDFEKHPAKPVIPEKPTRPPEKKIEKKVEEPRPADPSRMNRWTIAMRSAVVPGWGHWAADEKWEGAGYFTLAAGLAGYAASERSKALAAQSGYKSSSSLVFLTMSTTNLTGNSGTNLILGSMMNIPAYNAFQSKVNGFNNSMRLLGAVYAGQLVHAWFTGKSYERSPQGVAFLPLIDGDRGRQGVGMFYYWSF